MGQEPIPRVLAPLLRTSGSGGSCAVTLTICRLGEASAHSSGRTFACSDKCQPWLWPDTLESAAGDTEEVAGKQDTEPRNGSLGNLLGNFA